MCAMKSRLFTAVLDDPNADGAKTFARHVRELVGVTEDARKLCLDALPSVRAALTERERDKIVEELVKASNAAPQAVRHSLAIQNYLADILLNDKVPADDYKKWADDLLELQWLKQEHRAVFESTISALVSTHLPKLRSEYDKRRTRSGVMPTFSSFGITVEVRPIRKDRYRWGTNVDDYRPEILGTTMIASIHIGVDEGSPEDFYFQADEQDIDNMISSLIAAKKDMSALSVYLGLESSGEAKAND
ncbi:MAG: hypothetical protein NTW87_24380 [Planctomycetota bacterium]|nr:hypothetical protein [Planctomycetota bacterium]